jgi:signal transduction histidine kinase
VRSRWSPGGLTNPGLILLGDVEPVQFESKYSVALSSPPPSSPFGVGLWARLWAQVRDHYAFFAVLCFGLLMFMSYGETGDRLSFIPRIGISALAGGLLYLTKYRPVVSLFLTSGLCIFIGWFAPSLNLVQILLIVILFLVSWKSSFSLAATLLTGVVGVGGMYLGKVSGTSRVDYVSLIVDSVLTNGLAVGFGAQTRRLRVANDRLVELAVVDRRNAVVEERRRIARELHDVAAHHLSAVVVKSKVALRLDTPEDLRDATSFAASSSSEALNSMRTLVGVLAEVDEVVPLAPQPRLDELENIKERMESAGLDVDLTFVEPPQPLTRQVELAVVRIVQESLTNVLRHRGPGKAWVTIASGLKSLEILIDDDGSPPNETDDYGSGHGLLGMAERATACGGVLAIERSPRGGWRVAASLPTGPATL